MPGYANPQNLNRYSYVNNNPLRYTDPTGHMLDEGCSTGCGYTSLPTNNYCTTHPWACTGGGGGGGGNSGGSGGGYEPPVVIPDLPCGGMLTCNQQTPYEYTESLLPFTSSDACYFLLHDPILCTSSSWQNFPSVSLDSPLDITMIDAETLQLMCEEYVCPSLSRPFIPSQVMPPHWLPEMTQQINTVAEYYGAVHPEGVGPGDIATGQVLYNFVTQIAPVYVEQGLANVDSFIQILLGPFGL